MKYVLYFCSRTFHSMCAGPNMAVFCTSLIIAFLVRCSGIVCVILKWYQPPLLLLVSHFFSHSTCAEFLFGVIIIIIIIIICLKGRALVLCTAYLISVN